MTNIHFEELWEKCENFHKESTKEVSVQALLDDMSYKITLYKALDSKSEIPKDELEKAKSRIMGEILLTLTNLSLRDNINVFDALGLALQYKSVGFYTQKHSG